MLMIIGNVIVIYQVKPAKLVMVNVFLKVFIWKDSSVISVGYFTILDLVYGECQILQK